MNLNILKFLVIAFLFYSCDQLEEDTLAPNVIDKNSFINHNNVFAVSGQSTIIDVLGNPQESAIITLSNSSDKAKHTWLSDHLLEYVPHPDAEGEDYLVFQIETSANSVTDSIFIQIGDPRQLSTDSCIPYAKNDQIILDASLTGTVDLLANDELCNYQLQDIFLVKTPSHGTATITGNSMLEYTGSRSIGFQDSVIYKAKLTSSDSAQSDRSILAFVNILSSSDSTCAPIFNTGFDSVSVDQAVVELDVLSHDELCDWPIKEMSVANFSLGTVQVTDSNSILFEPQIVGLDSIQFEILFENGTSAIGHHLVMVTEPENSVCDSILALHDTLSLGYPANAVVDIDVLQNDLYCEDLPTPIVYILDSANVQYGVAEIIEDSGYPLITYKADSLAWQNDVEERISYKICQGQECSESIVTLLK